jgi:hypothetical protein
MVSWRDEKMESYIRDRLGIGLPPGREQLPSLRLRLDNGMELERDSLVLEVQRVSFSDRSLIGEYGKERGITAVLDGIGRDLDSMMSSIRSYNELKERLY